MDRLSVRNIYFLLFGAGFFAVFALAPFHFWFANAVSTVIWFLALDNARIKNLPLRAFFWRSFVFGFAYFALGMFWVAQAFLVDAAKFAWLIPFAMSALPAGFGIYYGIGGILYGKFAPNNSFRTIHFALIFALIEFLRSVLFTGIPWNLTAYIWKAGGIISQNAALVGPFSISFLTILCFSTLAIWREKSAKPILIMVASFVIIGFSFGAYQLFVQTENPKSGFKVAVGQAGFSQKDLWAAQNREKVVSTYIRQLQSEAAKNSDLIVWPEGAFPFDLTEDADTLKAINDNLLKQVLVVGAPHADFDGRENTYFNSMLFLSKDEGDIPKLIGTYDKYHLVPFGEYLPFRAFFNSIGVSSLVAYGTDFTKGDGPKILKIGNLPAIDPRICYEIIFPRFNRSQIRPQMILNVSVDAWYGDYLGPDQHYNQARWRAIEEGVPLVRAASGGWSGIVDTKGRAIFEFDKDVKIQSSNLPMSQKLTFYARFGDAIFFLLVAVFAAITYSRKS